jgi:hypothetical protein
MYALLLVLSALCTAVGVFAIGFGIPNHEFGLGNTLILAGAVAIVGGIVTFGLAVAVRQLRRIAELMDSRPVAAPRRQPAPESSEGAPVPAPAPAPRRAPGPAGPPIPYPARPDARDPRPEIRPAPAPQPPPPAMEAPEPPPIERPPTERPRPNIFGVARGAGDPPVVDEPETVPLAPNRVSGAPISRGFPPPAAERMPEPPPEPRPMPPAPRPTPEPRPATPADIMARLANLATSPQRPAPVPRPEPPRTPPASERPPEARPRQNMFDTLWPADGRGPRQSQSETIARAPKQEAPPEPEPDAPPEPKVDIREPRLDFRPEPRSEPRSEPRADLRFEPPRGRVDAPPPVAPREPMMPPPAEQRPIAILKSGVIDGMAYTLYTDGSIEAELPQGTMRFSSIDELRAHLESTERRD